MRALAHAHLHTCICASTKEASDVDLKDIKSFLKFHTWTHAQTHAHTTHTTHSTHKFTNIQILIIYFVTPLESQLRLVGSVGAAKGGARCGLCQGTSDRRLLVSGRLAFEPISRKCKVT